MVLYMRKVILINDITVANSNKKTFCTKIIRPGYKNSVLCVMCSDGGYPYFVDSYCSSKYGELKVYKNPCAGSVID